MSITRLLNQNKLFSYYIIVKLGKNISFFPEVSVGSWKTNPTCLLAQPKSFGNFIE
jgi:hypothetical protein